MTNLQCTVHLSRLHLSCQNFSGAVNMVLGALDKCFLIVEENRSKLSKSFLTTGISIIVYC